jgi:pimeloyl-ACP methyl ester carboxylesterase
MATYKTWGNRDNKAIVAIFGFGMSEEDWYDLGYVKLLKDSFYFIAINPFDFSPDSGGLTLDYATKYIEHTLDDLNISSAIIWGYSLGAKVAIHFSSNNPHIVQGLIMGGFELKAEIDHQNDLVINTLRMGAVAWVDLWKSMFDMPIEMEKRFLQANTSHLINLRCTEATWPDLENAFSNVGTSACIIYAAEKCFFKAKTKAASEKLNNCQYIEIPNCNHFEAMLNPNVISSAIEKSFF